jgi:ParB family chromosome partitioning protein
LTGDIFVEKERVKRGLGRGLSALMSDVSLDQAAVEGSVRRTERMMPVEKLMPNPDQPRHQFVEERLEELAASIREKGVIQPLIVRPFGDGYQIVAGERRWRAAQMAQVHEVPVVIREMTDTETLEVAIIENIQRADLNPIEEALGYCQLIERFGHTQEQLAKALGKSRSHIANMMRLMGLPPHVKGLVELGTISMGHARALVTLDEDRAEQVAHQIVSKGLSVRDTEKLLKSVGSKKSKPKQRVSSQKDADTQALEGDLSANLGMPVTINHMGGSGQLVINYRDLEDLDALCRVLSAGPLDGSR